MLSASTVVPVPGTVAFLHVESKQVKGSGYFASRGKIAHVILPFGGKIVLMARVFCHKYQNSPLTQTLILTLIPTLTQTEEKHYFAFRGKIATSKVKTIQKYTIITLKVLVTDKFYLST